MFLEVLNFLGKKKNFFFFFGRKNERCIDNIFLFIVIYVKFGYKKRYLVEFDYRNFI